MLYSFMQWTIILEATTGWGERTCTPVYTLSRPTLDLKPEQVGLTLAEAKTLLARLQEQLIRQQADEYATCRRVCPRCHQMQPVKEYQPRAFVAANDASLVNYGERYRRGARSGRR